MLTLSSPLVSNGALQSVQGHSSLTHPFNFFLTFGHSERQSAGMSKKLKGWVRALWRLELEPNPLISMYRQTSPVTDIILSYFQVKQFAYLCNKSKLRIWYAKCVDRNARWKLTGNWLSTKYLFRFSTSFTLP